MSSPSCRYFRKRNVFFCVSKLSKDVRFVLFLVRKSNNFVEKNMKKIYNVCVVNSRKN